MGHGPRQLPWRIVTDDETTVVELSSQADGCNQLIEFADGHLDVPPVSTTQHQTHSPRKFRESDLLAPPKADNPRRQSAFWLAAALVAEVASPLEGDRQHHAR